MKRGSEGWVLAMQVPPPGGAGPEVTVFWCGPNDPSHWAPSQQSAARFVDEALARHLLGSQRTHRPDGRPVHVYAVPALAARNGGPATPVVAWPGQDQPGAPEQEQGDLFA